MYKISEVHDEDMHNKSDAYKFIFGNADYQKLIARSSQLNKLTRKPSGLTWSNEFSNLSLKHETIKPAKLATASFGQGSASDKLLNLNQSPDNLFLDEDDVFRPILDSCEIDFSDINADEWALFLEDSQNIQPSDNDIEPDCILLDDNADDEMISHFYVSTNPNKIEKRSILKEECETPSKEDEPLSTVIEPKSLDTESPDVGKQLDKQKTPKKHGFTLRKRASSNSINSHQKNMDGSKTSFKWNWFSLGRTWFRGMSNYYKNKFENDYKQWLKNESDDKKPMEQLITEFMKKEFKFNESFYDSTRFQSFLDCMITVLHSQNYKKKDSFIVSRDFSTIRNLLYWYSANAKRSFVSNKNYAYIFNHFYNEAGEDLVKEKSNGKPDQFRIELCNEMDDINKLAIKAITDI